MNMAKTEEQEILHLFASHFAICQSNLAENVAAGENRYIGPFRRGPI